MSQKPPRIQIVLSDSFYESVQKRHADQNALRASQGLPPVADESPFISQSQAKAQAEAEAKQRASQSAQKTAANLAPPPPTRGPLCRAAKAKVAERTAAIPGFDRHSRKCQICRSPYVDDIEQLYLQWEEVDLICRYFQLADADTVYGTPAPLALTSFAARTPAGLSSSSSSNGAPSRSHPPPSFALSAPFPASTKKAAGPTRLPLTSSSAARMPAPPTPAPPTPASPTQAPHLPPIFVKPAHPPSRCHPPSTATPTP